MLISECAVSAASSEVKTCQGTVGEGRSAGSGVSGVLERSCAHEVISGRTKFQPQVGTKQPLSDVFVKVFETALAGKKSSLGMESFVLPLFLVCGSACIAQTCSWSSI